MYILSDIFIGKNGVKPWLENTLSLK